MMSRRWARRLHSIISIVVCLSMLVQSSPLMAGPMPAAPSRAASARADVRPAPAAVKPAGLGPHPVPEPPDMPAPLAVNATPGVGSDASLATTSDLSLALPSLAGLPAFLQSSSVQPINHPHPDRRAEAVIQPDTEAADKANLSALISLTPGWNLVSIPETLANPNPAAVLASIAGSYSLVYAYNACDTADPWKLYDPAAPPPAIDLTAIDPKIGFWIHMTAAGTLNVSGSTPTSTNIPICRGWNLVGYPLATSHPVATALASIAGKYTRVFAYNLGDTADPWEVYDTLVPTWVNDLQTMTPGRGYWVHATEDTTLTIAAPPAPPTLTPTPPPTPPPGPSPTPSGPPPSVSIASPTEAAKITTRTDIVGSVSSSTLASWRLEYRLSGETTFIQFASGTTQVTNATLGAFDPTLLLNGLYDIRLLATDVSGRSSEALVSVVVEGNQKVGNFTVSFADLEVPVVGLPIQIVRTYDSRDKRMGDFGVGWTLDLKSVRVQENGKVGRNWRMTNSGGFIPQFCIEPTKAHIVTVTLSDGRVHKFEPFVEPRCEAFQLPDFVSVGLRPLPGTDDELAPIGISDVFVARDGGAVELVYFESQLPLDFDQYDLTLPTGQELVIDQFQGLQSITDLNGNKLTVSGSGITHSSGKGVPFHRDAQGRITRITDPNGNWLTYSYDANGNLAQVTDQVGFSTGFTYNARHDLLDIVDPRGIRPIRNEYDNEGRLTRHIDADGKTVEYTHTLGTQQELITNRLGQPTLYEYDREGNVVRQTDALGAVTHLTYDARGNETSMTNALGERQTFTYDGLDNLLSLTDPLGHTTSFTYNSRGQILTTTDGRGSVISNTYDSKGNLIRTQDALGNVMTFTYDFHGNVQSETDPLASTTHYAYNNTGNILRKVNALGYATVYTYDANGNQLTETVTRTTTLGVETLITTHEYEGRNQHVKATYPDGTTIRTEYNSLGKPSAEIDELGRRMRFEYDLMGNLVRTIHRDGTTVRTAYDSEARKLNTIDQAGRVTSFTHDAVGRLVQTTHSDGSTRLRAYDTVGRPVAITTERGELVRYGYDTVGRAAMIMFPLGMTKSFTYDENGSQRTVTDANGHTTTFEYDANNRLTREVYHDGTSTAIVYDALGRRIAKTDQAGKTTRYKYDPLGRLMIVTDALGQVTTYAYDEIGNRISQTDAEGRTTRFEYDKRGRPIKRILPLGQSETMAYDAVGNLVSSTDFNGNTTTYSYDVHNWLIQKTYVNGSQVIYTYTLTGQRASVTDSRGTTQYEYDTWDRLVRVTHPDSRVISYTYDEIGNRTSVITPAGTTSYTYDALNRLATVIDPDAGVTTYTYDATGSRASVTLPNGAKTEYTYDSLNRLTDLTNKKSDGTIISRFTYTLGQAGNRLQVVEHTGRTVSYTYDDVYRLSQEQIIDPTRGNKTISYTYDRVGNRLTQTEDGVTTAYTYDANDRLLSEGGTSYTYDASGNVIGRTRPNSDQVTYQYDHVNRLIRTTISGAGPALTTVDYAYDADGNRIRKVVNGIAITNYLVDHNLTLAQVLLETDGADATLASYVYGDDLISMKRGSVTSYYHYDGQMSTRQLTNGMQAVTNEYVYDAFGEKLASTGGTENDYLYTGEQYDTNIGFYYLRARYYNPTLGRFATVDPFVGSVFEPQSLHKYVYVHNDPANRIDPTGLYATSVAELLVVALHTSIKTALKVAAVSSEITWIKETLWIIMTALAIGWAINNPDTNNAGWSIDYKDSDGRIEVGGEGRMCEDPSKCPVGVFRFGVGKVGGRREVAAKGRISWAPGVPATFSVGGNVTVLEIPVLRGWGKVKIDFAFREGIAFKDFGSEFPTGAFAIEFKLELGKSSPFKPTISTSFTARTRWFKFPPGGNEPAG